MTPRISFQVTEGATMVRTRPSLVLEHPDRQDAVGLPLVRIGVERRQGEEGIRGLRRRRARQREQAADQERGERPQGSPGVSTNARTNRARLSERPVRSATEAPGRADQRRTPERGRATARTRVRPSVPTTPSSSRGTSSSGPSATARTASAGSPARRAQARTCALSMSTASTRCVCPPLCLCRRARHDVVHREEPSDPVAEPGGIEGASGPAPEAGIPRRHHRTPRLESPPGRR